MTQLEEIPWNQLHHAYGTCEEFPRVLGALASLELGARRWARNWLRELLFHQETHYPANEFAVPFLLRAAANPELPERGKLLVFLSRFLATGKVPRTPAQFDQWKRRFQKKYGMSCPGDHWRDLRRKSLAAAWTSRDLLATMVVHDPEVSGRCWALYLLADLGLTGRCDGGGFDRQIPCDWFTPAAIKAIVRSFQERAVADTHPAVKVCAAFGIGFMRDDPAAGVALRALDVPGNDPAMRLAAAAARHVTERDLPQEVTARLVEGIIKNRMPGMGAACIDDGSESVLLAAYGRLGYDLEPGRGPSAAPAFAFVPFPQLTAWLGAAIASRLPLVDLVERSFAGATDQEQSRAVALVGALKSPSPEVAPFLLKLLNHDNVVIRMAAAVAVGRRKSRLRVPVARIVEAFRAPLRDQRATMRLRAIKNLCRLWSAKPKGPIPQAMPIVLEAAAKERNGRVRQAICNYLDRAAIEDKIDPTYQNLQPPLSANAKRAVRILAAWLATPAVAKPALKALRSFYSCYYDDVGPAAPIAALEPLLALLQSDAPHRSGAPAILARIRSKRVLPALIDSLRRDSEPDVRNAIRWALHRLPKSMQAADAVLLAHRESNLHIDAHVAQFLAVKEPASEVVAQTLVRVLENSDAADAVNRCSLVEAIGYLSGAPELTSNALLHAALTDSEFKVRWAAAKVLACAPVPVDLVLAGCQRICAARNDAALGGMLELLDHGNTPEMPNLARLLLFLLDDPDHHRREKAVKSLARMRANDAEVERGVVRLLSDESGGVAYSAAQYGFHVLPNSEVVPPLMLAAHKLGYGVWFTLKDRGSLDELLPVVAGWLATAEDWQLEALCEWTTEQGPKAARLVPALLHRLADPRSAIRFAIIDALLAVDSSRVSDASRAIEPLLDNENEAVRQKAVEVRARISSAP